MSKSKPKTGREESSMIKVVSNIYEKIKKYKKQIFAFVLIICAGLFLLPILKSSNKNTGGQSIHESGVNKCISDQEIQCKMKYCRTQNKADCQNNKYRNCIKKRKQSCETERRTKE